MSELTFEQQLAKVIAGNPGLKIVFMVKNECVGDFDGNAFWPCIRGSVAINECLDEDSLNAIDAVCLFTKENEDELYDFLIFKVERFKDEDVRMWTKRAKKEADKTLKTLKWKKFIEVKVMPS